MNPQLEPFIKNTLLRHVETIPSQRTLSSGFGDLDRVLPGGGWPIGALTEMLNSNDEGSGELQSGICLRIVGCGTASVRNSSFVETDHFTDRRMSRCTIAAAVDLGDRQSDLFIEL